MIASSSPAHASGKAEEPVEVGILEEVTSLELEREYQSIPPRGFEQVMVSQPRQRIDRPLHRCQYLGNIFRWGSTNIEPMLAEIVLVVDIVARSQVLGL